MLLRSSSTPILGSLFPESPNSNPQHRHPSFSCHLSSPQLPDSSASSGVRRTRSDGNLHALLSPDETHAALKPSSRRSALETIPSFSFSNANLDQQFEEELEGEEEEQEDTLDLGKRGEIRRSGGVEREFSFSAGKQSPLFLARGLGIDRVASALMSAGYGGGDGRGRWGEVGVGGGGGDRWDVEKYYKRMVEEDPCNALVLRNYAQFLYETKGDPQRAEEYYSRAILAEPGDGEILSQYAKLVWELHGDEERASTYFEQAVQASPQDSQVLGAYAGFLWETEEDDTGNGGGQEHDYNEARVSPGAFASAIA